MRGTCKYRRNASNNIHRLSRPAAICTIPEILRVGGLVLTETQRASTSLRNTVVGCTRGSDWVAIEFTQQFLNGVDSILHRIPYDAIHFRLSGWMVKERVLFDAVAPGRNGRRCR